VAAVAAQRLRNVQADHELDAQGRGRQSSPAEIDVVRIDWQTIGRVIERRRRGDARRGGPAEGSVRDLDRVRCVSFVSLQIGSPLLDLRRWSDRSALLGQSMRRDAIHNRERVLAAAEQIFGQQGPDASVDELADAAGVGMGTLYRHFPNKQALVDEIIAPRRRELAAMANSADAQRHGMAFEWLLVEVGRLQSKQPGCVARLWDHSDAERASLEDFRRHVAVLLADAQEAGRIRADVTPSDISMVFWSVREIVRITRPVAPKAWRRHLELQLAGLRPTCDSSPLQHPPLTDAQAKEIMRTTG
jgi:AcrR family transcriptional regulator